MFFPSPHTRNLSCAHGCLVSHKGRTRETSADCLAHASTIERSSSLTFNFKITNSIRQDAGPKSSPAGRIAGTPNPTAGPGANNLQASMKCFQNEVTPIAHNLPWQASMKCFQNEVTPIAHNLPACQ